MSPAAERYCDRDDWRAIESTGAVGRPDPLTTGPTAERFAELLRVINEESAAAERADGETSVPPVQRPSY